MVGYGPKRKDSNELNELKHLNNLNGGIVIDKMGNSKIMSGPYLSPPRFANEHFTT